MSAIGSLPHSQLELALQTTLQLDIPVLPQLPSGNPGELMIPAALEGVPGLSFDEEGLCTIALPVWEEGRSAFDQRLDQALEGSGRAQFEPSPLTCRAWKPFLWEVASRKLPFAKIQLAGPATVRWVARTDGGNSVADHSALDQQIFRLLLARGLAMVRAMRSAGTVPIFFLDEPGLYALDPRNPLHAVVLQELRVMVMALQREGALVGLHCCSNTHWPSVLRLGLDILSLDMRLSLDALLDEPLELQAYLASGATLSLGMVPTDLASAYEMGELVDSMEVALKSLLGSGRNFARICSGMLLTPACGLGMRSVVDAEGILEELREAQRALRAVLRAEGDEGGPPELAF